MTLLTESADYDEDGSWGRMSEGWPEIVGDDAFNMYIYANKTKCIPYGSYVLMDEKGRYGAQESIIRVHQEHLAQLKESFYSSRAVDASDGGTNL